VKKKAMVSTQQMADPSGLHYCDNDGISAFCERIVRFVRSHAILHVVSPVLFRPSLSGISPATWLDPHMYWSILTASHLSGIILCADAASVDGAVDVFLMLVGPRT
jgi:hypothetical protein